MASIERKQRLREDIGRLLRELNFAMEDARAHGTRWKLETGREGEAVYLNVSEESDSRPHIFTKREAAQECGVTTRTIERRLKPLGQRKGTHGWESYYSRADVSALKDEVTQRESAAPSRTL